MITSAHLAKIFPDTPRAKRDRFLDALNKYLPLYGITTARRVCAFLATGGVETDYLRTTTEYASGADYEGRKSLGNIYRGDGKKFRGRGFFQTTGRFNYFRVLVRFLKKLTGREYNLPNDYPKAMADAEKHGVNFLKYPEKLAEIEIAVESACIFWVENNLSKYADAGEFKKLSGIVNTGSPLKTPNHWAKRNELFSKCRRVIPIGFSFSITLPSQKENEPIQPVASVPTAPESKADTSSSQSPPPSDDSFLAAAFDKNVSADDIKTAAKSSAVSRILVRFSRPLIVFYAMLEAGNIYAWLGVTVGVIGLAALIYLHHKDLQKIWAKIKTKFTS